MLFLILGICVGLVVCAGLATTVVLVVRHQSTGDDLRSYLVPKPSGATAWQHPLGTDEHLSLDQEAALSTTDSASRSAELLHYQFRDGAVRTWDATNGDIVAVRLLRFGTPSLAEALYQTDAAEAMTAYGMPNVQTVTGVDEAVLLTNPLVDSAGYVHLYGLARKGAVIAVITVGEHSTQPARDRGEQLVKQQYDRL